MKLAAAAIDNFINSQISNLDSALLYGLDSGLAIIRKNNIIKNIMGDNFDDMLFNKFSAEDLIKEPTRLLDEVNSISLLGGRKFIVIYNCQASFTKIIENTIKNKKSDCFILLLASELIPSSSLRKFFETKHDNFAALPCYKDDHNIVYNIAKLELKSLNPSHEILSYIAHNLTGDRLLLQQELKKLKIYFLDKSSLDFEAVETLITTGSSQDFQTLANAIADHNPKLATNLLEELLNSSVMPITIIRVMVNYFQRIKVVRSNIEDGNSFNEAIKNLRPPVFFKQKNILEGHTRKWTSNSLTQILLKLENLEKTIKFNNSLKANNLLKYFVLILSNRNK
ncbi:MAG: DNA polymerase III subunit delta [Alphaproteobacteria bacterium]|nr:DNA polymerase III subunit delta [Alphaproteobacteria bacterium]